MNWVFERFIDLFGVEKKPYLLDCSIMFIGLLQQNLKYERRFFNGQIENLHKVVGYSLSRVTYLLPELEKTNEVLFDPSLLSSSLHQSTSPQGELYEVVQLLKEKLVDKGPEREKCEQLLDFIYDELVDTKAPRTFLLQHAIAGLESSFSKKDLEPLNKFI